MPHEYELKFLNIDKDKIRLTLLDKGYSLYKAETLMRRQTYHLPKEHVEHENKWGRIRDEGDKITATIKWYETPNNPSISNVFENEIEVNHWQDGVNWLENQGFTPTSYQENTREIWCKDEIDSLEIAIDIWPALKPYIEIEAQSEEQVNIYATELGFDYKEGIAGGTEIVYEIELGIDKKIIKNLPEITFKNPPKIDIM